MHLSLKEILVIMKKDSFTNFEQFVELKSMVKTNKKEQKRLGIHSYQIT